MNFHDEADFGMDAQQMGGPPQDLNYQPPEGSNFGPYPPHGGPGGPPPSGKEQAIMWQQGHYMGQESGFISASTTQPSSMTGHYDNLDDGACYTGPGSVIYDLDSAHISEASSLHSSHAHMGGLSNPEEFIPRLVGFLCDEDQVVVYEYLNFIERCVRRQNFFNALIRSLDLVTAIVQTLNNSTTIMASMELANISNNNNNNNNGDNNGEMSQEDREFIEAAQKRARSASNILRSMTNPSDAGDHIAIENQRIACQNILRAGGIIPMTRLLACRTDRIMFNAITTIHSILCCLESDVGMLEAAKNAIREENGVYMMVHHLGHENPKLLTILTDCLRILAIKNAATKELILQGNGPTLLVNIMKHQTYKNLIFMTSRLLKVLSVCPQNKPAIIQAGGLEALARHLRSEQSKITYHCSWTMRNLSDMAANIENPVPLALELVQLLRHNEEPIIIIAAGIISNLTVRNEPFKVAVCEADGISVLLQMAQQDSRNHELLEPALCGLRHLTNAHRKADLAQRNFIHDLHGLQKVARWLQPNTNRIALKPALGIIRNLAQKPINHQVMRDEHIIHMVLSLLSIYMKNGMAPNGIQVVNGIRWEEIVEACLSCIIHFSKDPINRTIIRDRSILHNLKCLVGLNPENIQIQRLSAGILNEISIDLEGAFVIQNEGLADPINALIHHRNEKIATYATSILYNLTKMKKECERGTFRPQMPLQQQQQQPPPQQQQQPPPPNMQMMPGGPPQPQHPHGDDKFSRSFPPDMGPGFDDMMSNPPMHQMNPGPPMGYPHQMMGGPPPPHHGGHPPPPHGGSPQGFMDELGGDMSMDIEGLMSPPYNSNYSQGFFDSGM